MAIPSDQLAEATALLIQREDKVPAHVRDQLKLCHRTEGNSIILFEFRPRLLDPEVWHEQYVAKFKYVQSRKRWRLYWMDSTLKWVSYVELPEAASFPELFREVDTDPICCFFG